MQSCLFSQLSLLVMSTTFRDVVTQTQPTHIINFVPNELLNTKCTTQLVTLAAEGHVDRTVYDIAFIAIERCDSRSSVTEDNMACRESAAGKTQVFVNDSGCTDW